MTTMLSNPRLVVIDNGYWSTKGFDGQEVYNIRTKYQQTTEFPYMPKTYQMKFNDKTYLIGEGAKNYHINLDKTSNKLHKIMSYLVLGLMSEECVVNRFNLVVLLPLSIYNEKNKESFKQYLITEEPVTVEINNKQIHIMIEDILVLPQCVVVQYNNKNLFKGQLVLAFDMGGLTFQSILIDNLIPMWDSKLCLNKGVIILHNKIKDYINLVNNTDHQDIEIPHFIREHRYEQEIEQIIREHLQEIKFEFDKKHLNVDTLQMYGTGGGIVDIQKYLIEIFPNAVLSDNPIEDNIRGAWEVGSYYYGKKNTSVT